MINNSIIQKNLKTICKNIIKIQEFIQMPDDKYAKMIGIGTNSLERIKKGVLPKSVTILTLIRIFEEFGIYPSQLSQEVPLVFLTKES